MDLKSKQTPATEIWKRRPIFRKATRNYIQIKVNYALQSATRRWALVGTAWHNMACGMDRLGVDS